MMKIPVTGEIAWIIFPVTTFASLPSCEQEEKFECVVRVMVVWSLDFGKSVVLFNERGAELENIKWMTEAWYYCSMIVFWDYVHEVINENGDEHKPWL